MLRSLFKSNIKTQLHRWDILKNNKYMDCSEKIKKCHSLNYEDYSLDRNALKSHVKQYDFLENDSLQEEDISVIALTYYHF